MLRFSKINYETIELLIFRYFEWEMRVASIMFDDDQSMKSHKICSKQSSIKIIIIIINKMIIILSILINCK